MKLSKGFIYSLLILFWAGFLYSQPSFSQDAEGEGDAPATESSDGIPTDDAVIAAGKGLFQGNCVACHQVHAKMVGPKLAGIHERHTVEWLINFIKYPQRTIESGDEYAAKLWEEYKPNLMPNHDFFSDEEIISILAYVKDETIKGPQSAATVATADGGDGTVTAAGPAVNTNLLFAVIAGLVAILVIVMVVMVLLVSILTKYLKQEKELTEDELDYINQRFNVASIFKSQAFIGIVAFIFVAVAAKSTVDGLFAIGLQQGYAPEQPISFSHKLHAGYYEIDCKYCHTGVEKSKSANIPSANICMNCHNQIKTTSPEIQKIYAAIEQDRPIQWVRVHNLPDLSYFNHAQHVKVAGLECQTCHGEIEEMEVVQQHSLLTMGWCIACHRQTEVNGKDNAYYDRLIEMHNQTSKQPMVVEDIGGLECSKCHY